MKVDFQKVVNERIRKLNNTILGLQDIINQLVVKEAIEFSISEILVEYNMLASKKGYEFCDKLKVINDIKQPVVYIFEMIDVSQDEKEKLIELFLKFRSPENKDKDGNDMRRSSSKVDVNVKKHSGNILYVGCVTKIRLAKRLQEHLGLGHKNTYSLQLKHWASNLKLKLYYIKIPNISLTKEIEKAVSFQLMPLLGKHEE